MEQPLIGIDPDDTLDVRVGGATFTLGIIEHGIWARLTNEIMLSHQAGKRHAIRRMAADGLDPEEVLRVFPAEGKDPERVLKQVDFASMNEPQYQERLARAWAEVARHSVRAHAGFLKRDGTGVPFATELVAHEGRQLQVVAAQTMRWYAATPGILEAVYLGANRLQELGATEKKD